MTTKLEELKSLINVTESDNDPDYPETKLELNYGLHRFGIEMDSDEEYDLISKATGMTYDRGMWFGHGNNEMKPDQEIEGKYIFTGDNADELAKKFADALKHLKKIKIWIDNKVYFDDFKNHDTDLEESTHKIYYSLSAKRDNGRSSVIHSENISAPNRETAIKMLTNKLSNLTAKHKNAISFSILPDKSEEDGAAGMVGLGGLAMASDGGSIAPGASQLGISPSPVLGMVTVGGAKAYKDASMIKGKKVKHKKSKLHSKSGTMPEVKSLANDLWHLVKK